MTKSNIIFRYKNKQSKKDLERQRELQSKIRALLDEYPDTPMLVMHNLKIEGYTEPEDILINFDELNPRWIIKYNYINNLNKKGLGIEVKK